MFSRTTMTVGTFLWTMLMLSAMVKQQSSLLLPPTQDPGTDRDTNRKPETKTLATQSVSIATCKNCEMNN